MKPISELKLADMMSAGVLDILPSATIVAAAKLMADRHISCLLVREDRKLLGILTERDVVRLLHGQAQADTPVSRVMSQPVLTARHDDSYLDAFALLGAHQVRHLVVADDRGYAVGVLSETDFQRYLGMEVFRKTRDLSVVMERSVLILPPQEALANALARMAAERRDCVVVAEGSHPLGILTERDMPQLLAGGADVSALTLGAVMHGPLLVVPITTPVAETALLMAEKHVRHMGVVNEAGELAGIVSQHRLLEGLGKGVLEEARRQREHLDREKNRIETQLDMLLDVTGVHLWEYDHGADRNQWSDSLRALMGLSQAPDSMDAWLALMHPEDVADVLRRLEAAAADPRSLFEVEFRLRAAKGHWVWFHSRGRAVQWDEEGQPTRTAGIMVDVSERKNAERALAEREEYLKAVLDNFPFLVWLKDKEGRFLAVNTPFARACGQASAADVVGKTDLDIWPRELAECYRADDRAVLESAGPKNVEEPADIEGEARWIETYKSPVRLGDCVIGTVGFARDVTARREVEESLRQSQRWLDDIFAFLPDPTFVVDRNGRVIAWNRAMEELTGVPAAAVLGKGDHEYALSLYGERRPMLVDCVFMDPEELRTGYKTLTRQGDVFYAESFITSLRGKPAYLSGVASPLYDSDGRLVGAIEQVRDYTLLRQAEEGLRTSEMRYRSLFSALSEGILLFGADGRIQACNPAAERMLGVPAAHLIGVPADHPGGGVLREDLTPMPVSELPAVQTLATGQPRRGVTLGVPRQDKGVIWLSVNAEPIFSPDETLPVAVVSSFSDITEQRQIEAELDQHRHHLEEQVARRTAELEAAKLAAEDANRAKSVFLANMSHEIRTPMNAVVGLTHLLLRRSTDADQQGKLKKIDEAAHHLLSIINDILDISKIEAGRLTLERTDFSLGQVIERVCTLVLDKVQAKGLELVVDMDPALSRPLRGDAMRLGQILLNYAANAVKFTERGLILLRGLLVNEDADGLTVRFEVRDSGIGIAPEVCRRLFAAFEQADSSTTRKYGGTGLGLVINRRLAELMDGQVGVDSEPGVGSTFWFTARLGRGARAMPGASMDSRLKGWRGLVVDDTPEARSVLAGLLTGFGMRVEACDGGAAALAAIQEADRREDPFRLVFLDWRMPGMDGLATARHLAQLPLSRPPAYLMVTAYDEPHLRETVRQQGFHSLLVKPVTASDLYDTLMGIVGGGGTPVYSRTGQPVPAFPGVRILLAEDNPVNQEVAMDLLREVGCQVDLAEDGARAVAMSAAADYDLILMDVQMPVMDGLEACRAIRRQPGRGQVPILAMTANAFAEDRVQCLAAGMNDHVGKPVDPGALYATLARCLPGRQVAPPRQAVPVTAAPQEGAEGVEALAGIDGLDVAAGLRYLGGRMASYRRMLGKFAESHALDADTLRAHLAAGALEDMQHLAHSLKGVSGTLGMARVRAAAAGLEMAVREGALQEELARLTNVLEGELLSIASALRRLSVKTQAKAETVDWAEVGRVLAGLESLLLEDDYQCSDFLGKKLPGLVAALGQSARELERRIGDYDYPGALELLRSVRASRSELVEQA